MGRTTAGRAVAAAAAAVWLCAVGVGSVNQWRCESVLWDEHVVSKRADGAAETYALDIDGDGDIDMLSAASKNNEVAWYENDGLESFTEHILEDSAKGAYGIYATDVDLDGDVDVLSASYKDDTVAWYENDGSENFDRIKITKNADYAHSVGSGAEISRCRVASSAEGLRNKKPRPLRCWRWTWTATPTSTS